MISVLLVGYGYWGPNLARNVRNSKDFILHAICDFDLTRVQLAKEQNPGVACVTSLELVDIQAIDAVIVATPVSTHRAVAEFSLSNGCHVLVEKPLAANSKDCESLMALADENDLVLMTDHTFLYTGAVKEIKHRVGEGEIGEVYYYEAERANLGLFQTDINSMWDLSVHDVSILNYLLEDKPRLVSAQAMSNIKGAPENVAYLTIVYDGRIANIRSNWLSPVKSRRITIGGSKKLISYDELNPVEKVKIFDMGLAEEVVNSGFSIESKQNQQKLYRYGDILSPHLHTKEPLSAMLECFHSEIVDKKTEVGTGEQGLKVVRILEAAQQSIKKNGAPIKI